MQQSATQSTAASEGAHDFGCLGRQAILFLAGSGVLWFIDGLLLTLVASIQAYMPGFMEGCPSLHYGRVRPAAHMSVIYGFLAQVGLAFVLWLFARQGKAVVRGVGAILIGTILWNIGVTYGVANVLLAGGTGFQWVEFPLGASRLMMIGYLLIAVPALMTYRSRSVWATEPQQWFALVALLALPWLYISANILLVFQPVRGVVQLTTSAWFVAGLSNLWLTPLGHRSA